jgi:hypothetical protein
LFRSEFPSDITPISPGKRKFDSSSEESPESGRWASAGAVRGEAGVNVLETEVGGPEAEEGAHPRGSEDPEIIVGIDPFMEVGPEISFRGQEMQERKSMRMLPSRVRGNAETRDPMDNMDLDHVVEDSRVAEESGAVRHIALD